MLEAAEQFLSPLPGVRWSRPTGGLYVWLQLPEDIDTGPAGPLLDRALAEGVLYVPGRYCYPNEGEKPRHNMIRLSFGVQSPETIRKGIELLSRAIKQL
jgi:2-aminoadipate transaminase